MSFILIGFGKRTHKDFGETGRTLKCLRCSNPVVYHLTRINTYFTFFFIPIFPYRSAYRIECPICLHGIELRGSEIKAAKQGTLNVYVSSD
jgi:zinc-ribbon family